MIEFMKEEEPGQGLLFFLRLFGAVRRRGKFRPLIGRSVRGETRGSADGTRGHLGSACGVRGENMRGMRVPHEWRVCSP